jgi:hypothetical protein
MKRFFLSVPLLICIHGFSFEYIERKKTLGVIAPKGASLVKFATSPTLFSWINWHQTVFIMSCTSGKKIRSKVSTVWTGHVKKYKCHFA